MGPIGWIGWIALLSLLGLIGSAGVWLWAGERWALAAPVSLQDAPPLTAREVTEAEFALSLAGPWQTVQLPDTWARRGIAPNQIGHYRVRITPDTLPSGLWALRADRLSVIHEVRLNGRLIHGSLDRPTGLRRPMPTFIGLAPDAFVSGENLLLISTDAGVRAGLSSLIIGPDAAVAPGYEWSRFLAVTTPQFLNSAGAGISIFMLSIWWRRRNEVAMGYFAALSLIASLRNHGYHQVTTGLNPVVTDGLFFVIQVVTVVMLGFFSMAFAGRSPRSYRLALKSTLWALPLIGAAGLATGQMHLARAWCYPWLAAAGLPGLWLILGSARQRRSLVDGLLVFALAAVLMVGMHDYLYQQGRSDIMDSFWLPYAMPLFTAAFSMVLLNHVVRALSEVEGVNLTLEQRVSERTCELEAANQAKSRFLAAASHDLRQPMTSIGLLVALLREQTTAPAVTRIVQRLHEATLGMEDLFKRLLDLSRLDSGTVRPRLQSLAVQQLFDAIATHHAEPARRKGLRLVLRPSSEIIHSDPLLLEQIVRNLVANAVRYTEQGGVLMAARREGRDCLRLEVWDTGPGIAADQQALIFDEFVQLTISVASASAATQDRSAGGLGLGLGLSIAQRCAHLLQAPLRVRSRPGRGSCFSISVPLARQAPQSPPVASWATAKPGSSSASAPQSAALPEPAAAAAVPG